jgi:peptidoglycan/LPS O-acetylase OafA/YrhL
MKFPDGLRAIAAMIVVLPHCAGLFSYWQAPSLMMRLALRACDYGHLGVQIFFVLSGFVIAYTLRDQKLGLGYIGKFLLRRSIRLDPPYWAAIVFYIGYLLLQAMAGHQQPHLPGPAQVVAHLFYLQNILRYGDINVVFWTLCIEIQFYLVFCLLLWGIQSVHEGKKLIFMLAFVVSLAWPMHLLGGMRMHTWFVPYWYAFLVGAIVWWTVEGKIRPMGGYASIAALIAIAAVRRDVEVLVVAVTAGAIMAASYRDNLYHWLNMGPIQFLGKLSYCIYLVHVPVVGVVLAFQVRLAPRVEVVSFVLLLVIWALSVGVAYVMHVAVEVPALRLSKRLKNWGVVGSENKPPGEGAVGAPAPGDMVRAGWVEG